MSVSPKSVEKRKAESDLSESADNFDIKEEAPSSGDVEMESPPKIHLDQEKRMRREIANSNERRRMQSINAGFQSLRSLMPNDSGEKLSKAAILQQTFEYVQNLLSQNSQLKQMLHDPSKHSPSSDGGVNPSPPPKRKKRDTESSDEGISMGYDDVDREDMRREVMSLRTLLEQERRERIKLEEERRVLEARLYPESLQQVVNGVQHATIHNTHKLPEEVPQPAFTSSTPPTMNPVPADLRSKPIDIPNPRPISNSISRRNLETIVEAIRHLEGDALMDQTHSPSYGSEASSKDSLPHSEDSSCSDEDSSGRDSPVPVVASGLRHDTPAVTAAATLLQVKQQFRPATCVTDNYPIAMHLLHQQSSLHQPAVIVNNSS